MCRGLVGSSLRPTANLYFAVTCSSTSQMFSEVSTSTLSAWVVQGASFVYYLYSCFPFWAALVILMVLEWLLEFATYAGPSDETSTPRLFASSCRFRSYVLRVYILCVACISRRSSPWSLCVEGGPEEDITSPCRKPSRLIFSVYLHSYRIGACPPIIYVHDCVVSWFSILTYSNPSQLGEFPWERLPNGCLAAWAAEYVVDDSF